MIDFPVTTSILFGAVLGFLIGACCTCVVKILRKTGTAAIGFGECCPACHTRDNHISVIERICHGCGRSMVSTSTFR